MAATGNDGTSSPSYPAGDAKVVGVSATDQSDSLWSSSNSGDDTFLAAPGVGITADAVGGGTTTISGTSASAAITAGAAALLKADDPSASNGTIVGRLARNADPAGSSTETGNGRLNLERSVADTSSEAVVPAGAAPVGGGGPYVGPYVAAAISVSVAFPVSGTSLNTAGYNAGNSTGAGDIGGTVNFNNGSSSRTLGVSIKRNSDNKYWGGSSFSSSSEVFNSVTCPAPCTSNGAITWTYAFAAPADDSYSARATASDSGGSTTQATPNTFTIDSTNPATASVTTPADAASYNGTTVPATFSGSAADNSSGSGLNANSTTFTLQRPDGQYWTGSAWQVAAFNLATTHSITTGNTAATWSDNVVLPTWSSQPDGSYTVQAKATDKAGNTFTGSAITFTLDASKPNVTVNQAAGQADPTNTSPINFTALFSEAINASTFTASDVSVTGTAGGTKTVTITNPSADNKTFNLAISGMTTSGTVVASIPAAGVSDPAGNTNNVSTSIDNSVTWDVTAPTVSSINCVPTSACLTNATSVQFAVTFSESVTGVDSSDFSLTTTGVSGASITNLTGIGSTYTATVDTGSGEGTIRLDLNSSGTGIADAVGNPISGGFTTGQVYTVDRTFPTVSSITRVTSSPTNTTNVSWTVTFSESVTGVNAADFTLVNSGLTSPGPISVTPVSGTVYTVAASTGTGNGTLGLNLVDDDTIQDAATNKLGGTGTGNGNFTGQVYTVDKTKPSVTLTQAAGQDDPTKTSPINFTAVFTKPINTATFTSSDVSTSTSTAGGTKTVTITEVAPNDGTTFSVAVTGMTTSGSVIATIPAGGVSDPAGNTNNVSTSTDNTVSWDVAAPTTASVTTPTNGSSFPAASVPANFQGQVADALANGIGGLNGNSATFTLKRTSDNFFWNGSDWQSGSFALATTHVATTGSTAATWTSASGTLPTWTSQNTGTYAVQATATDKAGNTFSGTAISFTLTTNPIPTTTSISPTSKPQNSGTFALTVNGTGFVSGVSTVRFNGVDKTTTFVSSTQLSATIPSGDLTTTGTFPITVFNSAPGGGTSNAQTFSVTRSTTTSVSCLPVSATVGGSTTCTATVSDTASGSPTNPTGSVSWTSTAGSFSNSSSCALANVPASSSQSRCNVSFFAPTTIQTVTVTGTYAGSTAHDGSNGNTSVSVTACTTNKICIDGNMADWAALTASPSFGDAPTDAGGGSGDITAIRITSGDGNLYARWDETLTANRSMVASEGFSIAIDADRNGTPDHRGWVMFNSSGVATVQVQDLNTNQFITVGIGQQSCNFSPCSNGSVASIEASFPLNAFSPTGALIGLQTETRASQSPNSSIKDCVPGGIACNGYFNLDTDTGTVTVDVGHVTTTTLSCPDASRNLNQATGPCTATVIDTGLDTNSSPVTKARPTGTVNFSVANGTGTFSPLSCTLVAGVPTDRSTCTVASYTPATLGTGTHTLKATYAGDTSPIQFASSEGTYALGVTKRSTTTSVSCSPNPVTLGGSADTTCTATVTDNAAGGALTPTGTVIFSSNLAGTFSSPGTTCTLSGSGATATCSVVFTPTASGSHTITATYGGSATHLGSANTTSLTVNSGSHNVTFDKTGIAGDSGTNTVLTVTVNSTNTDYTAAQLPAIVSVSNGASVTYAYSSTVATSDAGKRYNLTSVTGPTSPITVTADTNVTGNYDTQYKLTLATNPGAVGTANISGGVNGTFYAAGTGLTLSAATPVTNGSTRYVFNNWSGDGTGATSRSVTMSASRSVTANYDTQYQVSFAQSGIGTDTGANTVLTVNGTTFDRSGLPDTRFWDSGVTWTYQSTVETSPASAKHYHLTSTASGTVGSTDAGTTITGTYATQYDVTFDQSGIGGDSSGTVLTYHVNAGADVTKTAAQLPVTITVNASDTVTYAYSTPVSAGANKRYVLTTPAASPASPITVSGPSSVTGTYKTQFQVTFDQSGLGATGNNTVLTVGASTFKKAGLPDNSFWDTGTTWTYQGIVDTDPASTTRYRLTSTASGTVGLADAGTTITGAYVTQYQISFAQT
ncbi:MAG: hypothetical protein ACJ77A_12450, partial [Actinomycetota bacterium]